MSQPGPGIHRLQELELEELLRQRQQETRAIEDALMRARSSSTTTTTLAFETIPGHYHVPPSRPPLKDHERLRNSAVPRTAYYVPGLDMEEPQQQVGLLRCT